MNKSVWIVTLGLLASVFPVLGKCTELKRFSGGNPWHYPRSLPDGKPDPVTDGVHPCAVEVTESTGILPWRKKLFVRVSPDRASRNESLDWLQTVSMDLSWEELNRAMATEGRFFQKKARNNPKRVYQSLEVTAIQTPSQLVWQFHAVHFESFLFTTWSDETCQILPAEPASAPSYEHIPGRIPTLR